MNTTFQYFCFLWIWIQWHIRKYYENKMLLFLSDMMCVNEKSYIKKIIENNDQTRIWCILYSYYVFKTTYQTLPIVKIRFIYIYIYIYSNSGFEYGIKEMKNWYTTFCKQTGPCKFILLEWIFFSLPCYPFPSNN